MANVKKRIVILDLIQDPSQLIRSRRRLGVGLLALLLLLFTGNISSLTVGSISSTTYQDQVVVFPNYDTDNQMLSLGSFTKGFSLQDATTTCTFSSIFPVAGMVGLHGGTLYFGNDLILQNIVNLNSSGHFCGNGFGLDLCTSITGLPATQQTVFHDVNVYLNADLNINGTVHIKGNCKIDGRGRYLLLNPDAHIIVDHGATLKFVNITVDGLKNSALYCQDDTGQLSLDNTDLQMNGDYSFTNGSILFAGVTIDIDEPHTFSYESRLTSTIGTNTTIFVTNGATFKVGRHDVYGREPLYFEDATSKLEIDGSTLSITPSGACFTRGFFVISKDATFDLLSTSTVGGLTVGDGTLGNDFSIQMNSGSSLTLPQGFFAFKNASRYFFNSQVNNAKIVYGDNFHFYAFKSFHMRNISSIPSLTAQIYIDPAAVFTQENYTENIPGSQYTITGTLLSSGAYVLGDNGEINVTSGLFPYPLFVTGVGSSLYGAGGTSAPIIIQGSGAELLVGVTDFINQPIILEGGTVALGRDIKFASNPIVAGEGTLNYNSFKLSTGYKSSDITLSSTLYYQSAGGILDFNVNLSLTSTRYISGHVTYDGNGNTLNLVGAGTFIIEKNSSITFKNLTVSGLKRHNIRCLDDSAQIIFDHATIKLSSDYSFTRGSILFSEAQISGPHTFSYESGLTSTISSDSKCFMSDEAILKIGRQNVFGREPLYFESSTSKLAFDNATLTITPSGANFTRGGFWIDNDTRFDILSTSTVGGLVIGNGVSGDNFSMQMAKAASSLRFIGGHMAYKNTTPAFFNSEVSNGKLVYGDSFHLFVLKSLLIKNIIIEPALTAEIYIDPTAQLMMQNYTEIIPGSEYTITGTWAGNLTYHFGDNGEIIVNKGFFPYGLLVTGVGNSVSGAGGITGPVFVQGAGAELNLGISGFMNNFITLNNGSVLLSNDLKFGGSNIWRGEGTVQLNDKVFSTGYQTGEFVTTSTLHFEGTSGTLNFLSDLNVTATRFFKGECTVLGNGHTLRLTQDGAFVIEKNSTLTLKDVALKALDNHKIRCMDDSAHVIFDNVTFEMADNYTFTVGSFSVKNRLEINGPHIFSYESGLTSTIDSAAQLLVGENSIFKVGRKNVFGREPLYFEDSTSKLAFDSSTLMITSSGANFTRGSFEVSRDCQFDFLSTSTVGGLVVGNGIAGNDFSMQMNAASSLNFLSGYFAFKNSTPDFFNAAVSNAHIYYADAFHFFVLKSFLLKNIGITPSVVAEVYAEPGTFFTAQNYTESIPGSEYVITGTRTSRRIYSLGGNGEIIVNKGNFPYSLFVTGAGNSLSGAGGGAGEVTVESGAILNVGLLGLMNNNIILDNGTLNLNYNLAFSTGNAIKGDGTVNIDGCLLSTGFKDTDVVLTSTIHFEGAGGIVNFNSDIILTATRYIRGQCTIVGNGNTVHLVRSGGFFVEHNSKLTFKDILIEDVAGNNIACQDDSAQIVFDHTSLHMSRDFSFTTGSLLFSETEIENPYTFAYESGLTSTISNNTKIFVTNSATFKVGRKNVFGREPLYFEDVESKLELDNATLTITPSGANFIRGGFIINRDCTIDILSTSTVGGLVVGDGDLECDFSMNMNPASSLNFKRGHFAYKNVTPAFFNSEVSNASIFYGDDIHFYVFESFLYKNITAYPSMTSSIYVDPTAIFTLKNYTEVLGGNSCVITGTMASATALTLDRNDVILLKSGVCPHTINVVGSGNLISGVGSVSGQIALDGPDSELTWDVQSPLPSYDLNLNGGRIIMTQDSGITSMYSFTQTGTIDIGSRTFVIGSAGTAGDWAGDIYWVGDGGKILLNGDTTLSGKWTFSGDITVEGNYVLDFAQTGTLLLERGAHVTFNTISLWNMSEQHGLICSDDECLLTLNNMDMVLSGNYTFDKGSIFVYWDSNIVSTGEFGTEYNFLYNSIQPSSIDSYATLKIGSGVRFSIGRQDSTIIDLAQQPLVFNDQTTATLKLDGGSLNITSSGMIFAAGTIDVTSGSKILVDTPKYEYGMILGDGTVAGDCELKIRSGVQLSLEAGNIYYDNVQADRVVFESPSSTFNILDDASFIAKTNCAFKNGSLSSTTGVGRALRSDPGSIFITQDYTENLNGNEYVFTGTISGQVGRVILGGNDRIILKNGTCPYDLSVVGTSNRITGLGFIGGEINLADSEARLIWDVPASLPNHDLNLNGGRIILTQDSGITGTYSLTNTGTIDIGSYTFELGSGATEWAGDIYWIGDGGKIILNNDVSLSGKWTFSGDIIVEGNDRLIDFGTTGTLLLERGAQATLQHFSLWNVSSNHGVKCSDNTCNITTNVVDFILTGDYVFDKGSIFNYYDSTVKTLGAFGTNYTFDYKSTAPLTVDSAAKFTIFPGVNFAIGRQDSTVTDPAQQPLLFNDPITASFVLNGGALTVTSSGMICTRGNIKLSQTSDLTIETPKYEYGLILGDGTLENDCVLQLGIGTQCNVKSGNIYYNNYQPDRIVFDNQIASLNLQNGSTLVAKTDCTLKNGSLSTDTAPNIAMIADPGIAVIQDNMIRNYVGFPYAIQKRKVHGLRPYLLQQGDYFFVEQGMATSDVIATQGVSAFGGTGGFTGNLSLANQFVNVHSTLETPYFNNITLNGGAVNFDANGQFAADKTLTGSGTINFYGTGVSFGPQEANMTSTLLWNGYLAGNINLGAKTNLSGEWSFGNTMEINGYGNVFDLSSGGLLKIRPASNLVLTNMAIKGLGDGLGNIEFMSDSSTLKLSNVYLELDNDWTTTIGGIVINGPVTVGLKGYDWLLDQNASMTVDGTTLWIDSMDQNITGSIKFGIGPVENYLSLVSSSTIKSLTSEENTVNSVQNAYYTITNPLLPPPVINNITLVGPQALYTDIYLNLEKKMVVNEDTVLDGNNNLVLFSSDNGLIQVADGKTLTLKNISFKDFSPTCVTLNGSARIIFDSNTSIYLAPNKEDRVNGYMSMNYTVSFVGTNNTMDGQGNELYLYNNNIDVLAGSSLKVRNIILDDALTSEGMIVLDNTATLTLQDVQIQLSRDYSFTSGRLDVFGTFDVVGNNMFVYQSVHPVTIQSNSMLALASGVTFSCYSPVGDTDILTFADATSVLTMHNATLQAGIPGLHLKKGKIIISGVGKFGVEMANDGSGGIEFGAQNQPDDCYVETLAGSSFELTSGRFFFRNIDPLSWQLDAPTSNIRMMSGTVLELDEPLAIEVGQFFKSSGATLIWPSSDYFIGSINSTL